MFSPSFRGHLLGDTECFHPVPRAPFGRHGVFSPSFRGHLLGDTECFHPVPRAPFGRQGVFSPSSQGTFWETRSVFTSSQGTFWETRSVFTQFPGHLLGDTECFHPVPRAPFGRHGVFSPSSQGTFWETRSVFTQFPGHLLGDTCDEKARILTRHCKNSILNECCQVYSDSSTHAEKRRHLNLLLMAAAGRRNHATVLAEILKPSWGVSRSTTSTQDAWLLGFWHGVSVNALVVRGNSLI